MKYTLPPHDDAAELQVLGNILLDNKLLNDLPIASGLQFQKIQRKHVETTRNVKTTSSRYDLSR